MRKTRRLILGLFLLIVAAFLLPLVININFYREQIAGALGAGLGRRVQVGSVRLKLLPIPGLVAQNVTVGEDPSFGAEAFARMTELRANLRLRSLWTGRLSFSSLVFVEPSLNLARRKGETAWNVASLFGPLRSGPAQSRRGGATPYLEFTDGRINFKDGDIKSVFFFSGVDGAVYQERGSLHLRFRGTPSRTDRSLTGAGEVRVEGELGQFSSTDFALRGPLALRVSLADAFLSDLLALARGAEPGIQGTLGLELRVSGRPEAPRFEGRIQLGNLRRWDLPPPQESAPLELVFSGLADLPARRLELAELRTAPGTVTAFGSVHNFLENPQWDLEVRLDGADAGRLFSQAQHFSARLSPGLRVEGRLEGAVHLAGLRASGNVTVKDFSLSGPNLKPLRAPEARLEFSGPMMRLQPVALPLEGGSPLTLGMACDWTSPVEGAQFIEVTAAGSSLPLPSLASLAAALGWPGLAPSSASALALQAPGVIADGRLSLNARLELERGAAPRVTGWAAIAKLRWAPAWLAQPVVLQTARLEFSGQQVKVEGLVASAGDSTITGTLRSRRAFDPPIWQAELRVDETGTSALGGMFFPGGTYPKYLARLEAKGKLEVGVFRLRGILLEELRTGFTVAGGRVVLRDARASLGGGRATGQVTLDFTHGAPEYEAQAQLTNVAAESLPLRLASGLLSGTLEFAATGHGAAEIGDSMHLLGSFTGRDLIVKDAALIEALRQTRVRALAAEVLVLDRRVRFKRLSLRGGGTNEAAGEGTDLEATGSVGFDRSLDLDFHTFRLAGTLAAPRRVSPAEVAHVPSQ